MKSYGAPAIDYNRFAKLYDSDPTIQGLIDNFDDSGIQIKTDKGEDHPGVPAGAPQEGKPMMAAAAKRAAANFGK